MCDFRYRARLRLVPPGTALAATHNPAAETQMLIENGELTVMVGGFSARLSAGQFVRVPAGIVYGWRNDSDTVAELLIHSVSPAPLCHALRLGLTDATTPSRSPA